MGSNRHALARSHRHAPSRGWGDFRGRERGLHPMREHRRPRSRGSLGGFWLTPDAGACARPVCMAQFGTTMSSTDIRTRANRRRRTRSATRKTVPPSPDGRRRLQVRCGAVPVARVQEPRCRLITDPVPADRSCRAALGPGDEAGIVISLLLPANRLARRTKSLDESGAHHPGGDAVEWYESSITVAIPRDSIPDWGDSRLNSLIFKGFAWR